jgi:hypothetical protein
MRLMGKSKLSRLARIPSLRGPIASFWHELEEYSWQTARDAARSYPAAKLDGHRLTVELDGEHCAVVALNFELGIALIEFAGSKTGRRRRAPVGESRKPR